MSKTNIPGEYPESAARASDLLTPQRHADLLTVRLHHITKASGERAADVCRKGFSVSRRQLRILAMLAGGRRRSPSELAERVPVDRGRMSRSLDEMEQRGFVVRQSVSGDARRHLIELTPAGEYLYQNLFAEVRELNLGLLTALDPEDRAALSRILATLEAGLGVCGPEGR